MTKIKILKDGNKKKKHSLEILKKKAELSLSNGQNSVYVRLWVRNDKLKPKTVYYLARSLEGTLSCSVHEFAKSARFAAIIRKEYGFLEFENFVAELDVKT